MISPEKKSRINEMIRTSARSWREQQESYIESVLSTIAEGQDVKQKTEWLAANKIEFRRANWREPLKPRSMWELGDSMEHGWVIGTVNMNGRPMLQINLEMSADEWVYCTSDVYGK